MASCGGAGAEEQTTQFLVMQSATYIFTTRGSNFDTVIYARDVNCTGVELGCNDDEVPGTKTSKLTLTLTAGQRIVLFVDGMSGQCGNYMLAAGLNP